MKAICLQGHSTGANKVVYYQSIRHSADIDATILLSPCDDIGILQNKLGKKKFEKAICKAQKSVKENKGNTLMPTWAVFYPMSARTYLDSYTDKSPLDVFPYRRKTRSFRELASVRTPILVIFGNNGEYVLGSIEDTVNLIISKSKSSTKIDTKIIDGAPHNYLGKEKEM